MERPCCKHELLAEKLITILKNRTDINLPSTCSPYVVLKNHETFQSGISSLLKSKKEILFFDKDHHEKKEMNRPVLLQSLTAVLKDEGHCESCRRANISLIEMKINHIYKNQQIPLWIVTRAQSTNLIDGTIYLIVRDQFDFHIRLVISNWSYTIPTNEFKSEKELSDILDELLPIGSMIKLFDPLLTTCYIDGQLSLRCESPNTQLILFERHKKCFVLDKLDDLRDRGNQSYIRGHNELAIDYYSYAINRIITMAGITISHDNDSELDLFRNAFKNDLVRLQSNRSACYLRERLYHGAILDSFVVVTGGVCNQTFDELFLKCLYRLICANIGLNDLTIVLDELFDLYQNPSINFNLRMKHTNDFNQIQSVLPRLRKEYQSGEYDLKQMFNNQSIDQMNLFDIHSFHSNFENKSCVKRRNNSLHAKCSIPAGTLLLVHHAFAFVKSGGGDDDRRLLNQIEKHLFLSPTASEFDLIRQMPCINEWFEDETEADENDYETYPKTLPWGLLVKTQQQNPFRSKSIIGWWPEASNFKLAIHSNQQANCLWFICGKSIFVFNFIPLNKNDELIIANTDKIRSFLQENQKQFTFLFGNKTKMPLSDIFDQLQQTQIYFPA